MTAAGNDADAEWERALRTELQAFVGADVYARFIARADLGRLQWWQEREWERFVVEHPRFAVSAPHLLRILQVCPLHGTSLQAAHVVSRPAPASEHYFEAATQVEFPCARSGWVPSERLEFAPAQADVLYCRDCRRAEAAWLEQMGEAVMPADWLLDRIELEGLDGPRLDVQIERMRVLGLDDGGREKTRMSGDSWRQKIEWFLSERTPDAELWTFRKPPSCRFPLRGGTGLAWVRGGAAYYALYVVLAALNRDTTSTL